MKTCGVCGNDYAGCFELILRGKTYTFDSFECAIHALAPRCVHCSCKILGHGVDTERGLFCCDHCARSMSSAGKGKAHAHPTRPVSSRSRPVPGAARRRPAKVSRGPLSAKAGRFLGRSRRV